jgi:hypothetical protein
MKLKDTSKKLKLINEHSRSEWLLLIYRSLLPSEKNKKPKRRF